MKAAITGHTKGLGLAIKEKLEIMGYEVLGFSRSNGYELPANIDKVISKILHCDLFINNAYADSSQSELLYSLFNKWRYLDKTIINISSRSGDFYIVKNPDKYSVNKHLLDIVSIQCTNSYDNKCKIINVKPGRINAGRNENPAFSKMEPEEVADVIEMLLTSPTYITEISLRASI